MSKYLDLANVSDPSLVISEDHLAGADVYVDAKLWGLDINPDTIALPNARLSEIAMHWAKYLAADEGAISEDSPLVKKARNFKDNAELLSETLSRKSLGIVDNNEYGNVILGRA